MSEIISVTNESPHVPESPISLETRNSCGVEFESFQVFTKSRRRRRCNQQSVVHQKEASTLDHG